MGEVMKKGELRTHSISSMYGTRKVADQSMKTMRSVARLSISYQIESRCDAFSQNTKYTES